MHRFGILWVVDDELKYDQVDVCDKMGRRTYVFYEQHANEV